METILLKSILCSGMLLGFYHIFLAKEKTFVFNRFYLLSALIFSLSIPFATIETKQIEEVTPKTVSVGEISQTILQNPDVQQKSFDYLKTFLIANIIITGLLFLKLIYSVLKIKRLKGTKTIYQDRKIVLLQKDFAPFSFWDTIYLSENYFKDSKIDETIFLHENIHLTQKHTADIFFIEILKAVFWFNPFIYFYKKAIINNHEFIADEAVIAENKNIKNYQALILQEILKQQNIALIHQFNFNNTKKRFIMMTKKNSRFVKAKKLLTIPILAFAGIIFAQKNAKIISNTEENTYKVNNNFSHDPINEYNQIIKKYGTLLEQKKYAEFHKAVSLSDRSKLHELYFQLTNEQRAATPLFFLNTPTKLAKTKVTQKDINDFMNSKKYGLWIDGKKTKNQHLKNFKPEDFSNHFVSKRYPNAISAKNPEPFQVDMMTNEYYQKYLNKEEAVHMGFKAKAYVAKKDTILPVKTLNSKLLEVKNYSEKFEENQVMDIAYGKAADIIPAEFPGGANKLRNLVMANFDSSALNGDEGTLKSLITFIVDESGKVRDIKTTGSSQKFNDEASRAIKAANDNSTWKPATLEGKPVAYQYNMPLTMLFEQPKKTQ